MVKKKAKKVYLFTKDLDLINKIRKSIYSLKIPLTFHLNPNSCNDDFPPDIIITDQRFFQKDNVTSLNTNTKTIYLTDNLSPENIQTILETGADNILFSPINFDYLLCLIQKYLGVLKTNEYRKLKHKGITLCKDSSSVTYNDCKVYLTNREFSVMNSIMTNSRDTEISKEALQVTVYRINKKTKEGIGLKLIKSRRIKGYQIAI